MNKDGSSLEQWSNWDRPWDQDGINAESGTGEHLHECYPPPCSIPSMHLNSPILLDEPDRNWRALCPLPKVHLPLESVGARVVSLSHTHFTIRIDGMSPTTTLCMGDGTDVGHGRQLTARGRLTLPSQGRMGLGTNKLIRGQRRTTARARYCRVFQADHSVFRQRAIWGAQPKSVHFPAQCGGQ